MMSWHQTIEELEDEFDRVTDMAHAHNASPDTWLIVSTLLFVGRRICRQTYSLQGAIGRINALYRGGPR